MAHLKSNTNIKKIQFGTHKTVKMGIGNQNITSPDNIIDTFKLKSSKDKVTSILDMVDVEETVTNATLTSKTKWGKVLVQSNK